MLCSVMILLFALIFVNAANASNQRQVSSLKIEFAQHIAIADKIISIVKREISQRSTAKVVSQGAAEFTIKLMIRADIARNGYAISEATSGIITISAHEEAGLLYGIGRWLRDARYTRSTITPGSWRGSSVPKMPVRGIYMATHFHNFYHDAPVAEVQRYIEELALWGVNSLMVWFDMHHFNGLADPASQKMIKRLRAILQTAKEVGMGRGLGIIANEGYANSPAELRAVGPGRGGFYGVELCPSKPGVPALLVKQFKEMFSQFADIGITDMWIWPYDQGSCSCPQCSPWGYNGFLKTAKPLAELARSMFKDVKIYLSTWYFDEQEWEGLAAAFKTKPAWVDALISMPDTYAFKHGSPGGLPLLGFPEISMDRMWPWGGFGANPMPLTLQQQWSGFMSRANGGYPYSEGIYEDINKVICAQLYWNPDRAVEDILKEYSSYKYSPEAAADILSVVQTLEHNHHMRWWLGLFEGYAGWFPSKGVAPQEDIGAEGAYETVKKIDSALPRSAKSSWRWRILYLRALLDAELKANNGKPNAACEQAFEELTRIYHAQSAQIDLKPPASPKEAATDITRLAAGVVSTATGPATASANNTGHSDPDWLPTYRPIPTDSSHPVLQSLDGIWKAALDAPRSTISSADMAGWKPFRIPGQWANQSFELADDTEASLGVDFVLKPDFKGKRLFLRFDAVVGGTEYWLNGQKMGSSEYYWTPVEFEFTKFAQYDQLNRLRIIQTRNVPGEKFQFDGYRGQGAPADTGFPRSVCVFALPQTHISMLHITTELDDHYRDAELVIDFDIDNPDQSSQSGLSLSAVLTDPAGKSVKLADSLHRLQAAQAGMTHSKLSWHVPNPAKWSDEKPHLYHLNIQLKQHGKLLEQIEEYVGFRTVEVKNGQICINGTPIKLHGACHHELHPLMQRSDTGSLAEADAQMLKAANINYCRTTHYPPTKQFLDACDKYGIYAEVECPFMWTRFVVGEDDTAYRKWFTDPTAATAMYHRNHPSVIMWSLANESGFEPWHQPSRLPVNYQATHTLVKRLDSTRLTSFHNEWNADGRTTDVGNLHYVTPPYDTSPWITDDPRPVICGEMYLLVSPGWKGAYMELDPGVSELWSMDNNIHWFKHCQRMSPQQAQWEQDENSNPSHGQNSPHSGYNLQFWSKHIAGIGIWDAVGTGGVIDPWRRPTNEWWAVKRMYSPVYIPVRQVDYLPGTTSIVVAIENRYSFTDLRELSFSTELSSTGVLSTESDADGANRCPFNVALPPMNKGQVKLPIPAGAKPGDLLIIRVSDANKRLVTAMGIRLGKAPLAQIPVPSSGAPDITTNGDITTIRGRDFGFRINTANAVISAIENTKGIALASLPTVFAISHWNTEAMYKSITQLPTSDERVVESIKIEKQAKVVVIILHERVGEFSGTSTLSIDNNGCCQVKCDHEYHGSKLRVGQAGLRLSLHPDYQTISWHRASEWDVYPDDVIGRAYGSAFAARDGQPSHHTGNHAAWLYPTVDIGIESPRKPNWPLSLDSTKYGTSDFRATKYNIIWAKLSAAGGRDIIAHAATDVNARACISDGSVRLHLWRSELNDITLENGSRIAAEFALTM